MQRLHESSPNEAGATANYARLGMLIEHNAAEAHRLAKEAYDQAPDDVNCAVTYAFSLYGQGRTSEGIQILQKLPNDKLHDSHAAAYVAVLLLDENQARRRQGIHRRSRTRSVISRGENAAGRSQNENERRALPDSITKPDIFTRATHHQV